MIIVDVKLPYQIFEIIYLDSLLGKELFLDWVAFSFMGAVMVAIVVILEKRLISVNIKRFRTFIIWVATAQLTNAALVYFIIGFPDDLQISTVITAYGAGLSYGIGAALFFIGMKLEEASRSIAIMQTYPIFVTILAVNFLGEQITFAQQLAIIIIVSGSYIISFKKPSLLSAFRPTKALPFLALSSFAIGVGFFGNKLALESTTLSTVYLFRCVGASTILILFFRPDVLIDMIENLRYPPTRYLIIVNQFILTPIAMLTQLKATSLGPVSLVSSIICTSPIIVFLLTAIFSKTKLRGLGEPLQKSTLALKGIAMFLVVGGLIVLQIT